MTRINIPQVNWPTALADAVNTAEEGDIIVVSNDDMKDLALRAIQRLDRSDELTVEVATEDLA